VGASSAVFRNDGSWNGFRARRSDKAFAASCVSLKPMIDSFSLELHRAANRVIFGTISFNSSRRLPLNSSASTFSPGDVSARFGKALGQTSVDGLPLAIMIGIVFVIWRAARALMEDVVIITSIFSASNSPTSAGRRSYFPSAYR